MTEKIEGVRNLYDNPETPEPIALNTSTYTNLATPNDNALGYRIYNPSVPGLVLVKEKEASDPDSLDRGFPVTKGLYESPGDRVATGFISAKSVTVPITINFTRELTQ